jgi:hypothetical protein
LAEPAQTEPCPRPRDVIAKFGHADAIAAHYQMHDGIGEKIGERRLLARLEPGATHVRKIRPLLATHNALLNGNSLS